ncbi:MAG: hypothetical protein ABSF48_24335, partial [Thermodesulfobacteriota bacterium]
PKAIAPPFVSIAHSGGLAAAFGSGAATNSIADILLANVPYVPTDAIELLPREARLYEARVALDGGGDGLDVLRRVAAGAPVWMGVKK